MSVSVVARVVGHGPLSPQQKWKAITIGTIVLLPAFWGTLIGLVSVASDDANSGVANPAAFIAFGLALVPFAFLALAFVSGHPSAPMATVKAMCLFLLIGIPVSAIAADAVTGLVAGCGRGRDRRVAGERGGHVEDAGARGAVRLRVHVRAGESGGRDHPHQRACVPVHEHRARRPLRGATASEGAG